MIAFRIAAVAAVLASASACTELDDVARARCGNGVIEPGSGEDCDGSEACGAPDTDQACRLVCDPAAATPTCPGTAVCGVDGVCHAPGGSFDRTASLSWTSPHLLIADTSGDGYPELIGVGSQQVDVRLGGRDLGWSALAPIPSLALAGTPRLADLEGDGDADVVLPITAGVFALAGDPLTVLDPFFYNSFDAPSAGRAVAAGVAFDPVVQLLLVAARGDGGNDVLNVAGTTTVASFPAGTSVDDVVGDSLSAGALVDGSTTVRTVALPFATGRAIALYDVTVQPAVAVARRPDVLLPLGTEVKNGVWFADLDGDGHLDLVASAHQGMAEVLAVAWGAGDGSLRDHLGGANQATIVWRSTADQDGDGRADGALEPCLVAQVTDNPVAVGDEASADVIVAGGLRTTWCASRSLCALLPMRDSSRDWAGAAIADVNLDGLADVVAFAADQSGLDVLLATGTPLLWNEATIATSGAVERVLTGDFNGDVVVDVAYIDAVAGVPYTDALSVAFGQFLGPPTAPVFMGSVGEALAAATLLAPINGQLDAISDLVMLTDREVDGGSRRGASILFGSTSRRLFAPLLPEDVARPGATADGMVVEDALTLDGNGDAYADLVVLTTSRYSVTGVETPTLSRHARLYLGQSDGQAVEKTTVELDLMDSGLVLSGMHWIGADVLAGGAEEAVGIDGAGRLAILRADDTCTGAACVTGVMAPAGELSDPVGLHAADADGDGDLDLFALLRNRGPGAAGREALFIWWNDGGFTPERVQRIDGSVATILADAAIVDLERDGTPELVLLRRARAGAAAAEPGLYAARLAGGAFGEPSFLAAAVDGVAVHAADVDGDALADLVVMTGVEREAPRELSVYLQSEARIAGAAED